MSGSASNPWHCARYTEALPRPTWPAGEIVWRLAWIIREACTYRPAHMLPHEDRRGLLLRSIAGYADLGLRGMPVEHSFHPHAAIALELAHTLDCWAPLAGKDSLRTELLWLDRLARTGVLSEGEHPGPLTWLRLSIAWLLGGLFRGNGSVADGQLLIDLLFDAEVRDGEVRRIEHAAACLVRAGDTASGTRVFAADFGRLPRARAKPDLGKVAQYLWWMRRGEQLQINRCGWQPAPKHGQSSRSDEGIVEVRFHRIQAWLLPDPGIQAESPLEKGLPAFLRGGSQLLEAALCEIRRVLLDLLGVGRLLIDGGGRLRLRCPARSVQAVDEGVRNAVDRLLGPTCPFGRRIAGVVAQIVEQGHLGAGASRAAPDEMGQRLARLAWASLPAISVTYQPEWNTAPRSRVLPIPVRRQWESPGYPAISPPGKSSAEFRRSRWPMSLPARLRVELGMLAPRERVLDLYLSQPVSAAGRLPFPRVVPLQQLLLIDLNRLGDVFTRPRQEQPAPEAMARRSFRFATAWLLAIRNTAIELEESAAPEVLALGGDDLLIGTRSEEADLLSFATRLHDRLQHGLNRELPPCDALSFCAGLVRCGNGGENGGQSMLWTVRRLEHAAKALWAAEVLATPGAARPHTLTMSVTRVGRQRRMSIIAAGRADAFAQSDGTGDEDTRLLETSRNPNARPGLAAPLPREQLGDVLIAAETGRPFELILEEDTGRAFIRRYQSRPHAKALWGLAPPVPCCLPTASSAGP